RLARRDLHERVAGSRAKLRQLGQLAGSAVDGVLDDSLARRALLDSARCELEQLGEDELGLLATNANSESDHAAWLPSARRSFAKIDSSERRFSSVSVAWSCSSSSRCSPFRRRGITTLTTTRRLPRRARESEGMPSPRNVTISPGCVPGSSSTSAVPSSVGTATVPPSAASGAATSSAVIRSSPSRTKRVSSATRTSTYRSPDGAPG